MRDRIVERVWSALSWFAFHGASTFAFGPCAPEWLLLTAASEEGGRHVG
jgi:hypothetical protein